MTGRVAASRRGGGLTEARSCAPGATVWRENAGVTSPYLNRPRRGLEQALKDRGMTRADVGMTLDARAVDTARRKAAARGAGRPSMRAPRALRASRLAFLRHARLSLTRAAVAGALVLAVAAIGLMLRVGGEPDLAETERAEELVEIAPAAGPAVVPHGRPADAAPPELAPAPQLGPAPQLAPTLAPRLDPAQAPEGSAN